MIKEGRVEITEIHYNWQTANPGQSDKGGTATHSSTYGVYEVKPDDYESSFGSADEKPCKRIEASDNGNFCDVFFKDGRKIRVFNLNKIIYGKP